MGEPVILDFGLAQIMGRNGNDDTSSSSDGVMVGSVDYMSPEQANVDHELDERTDIFHCGCSFV